MVDWWVFGSIHRVHRLNNRTRSWFIRYNTTFCVDSWRAERVSPRRVACALDLQRVCTSCLKAVACRHLQTKRGSHSAKQRHLCDTQDMGNSANSSQQTTGMTAHKRVVLDGKELDAAAISAQRAARTARGQMAKVLLIALGVGLVAIFLVSFWVSRNASGGAGLAVFLLLAALLFMTVFFVNNYWQWRVLQVLDLRCPHCEQPLGGDIHWTKRPGYSCPHCGKDAVATARQLGDA